VIICSSLYNCIIGRTGLTLLGAACSTAHLKLKYHADNNTISTLHSDIEAAQRCFLQANKLQGSASLIERWGKRWCQHSRFRPDCARSAFLQIWMERAEEREQGSTQRGNSQANSGRGLRVGSFWGRPNKVLQARKRNLRAHSCSAGCLPKGKRWSLR